MTKALPTNRHITYRQEYRRCGRCSQCKAGGRGHGPYVYAYFRDAVTKRLQSKYMGKVAKAKAGAIMNRNPGSSGQTWKLSTLVSVEVHDGKVVSRLSCGHEYAANPSYVTPEIARQLAQKRIGTRQGCRECSKAVKS